MIRERFEKIVREHLGLKPDVVIDDATRFDELGADSLDNIELIMIAEEVFHITLDDEAAARAETFGEALALIEAKLDAAKA